MHAYAKVIQGVKTVNRQAALIMAKQLPLLKMRGLMAHSVGPCKRQEYASLSASFIWRTTPQGHGYWRTIADNLGRGGWVR